MWVFHKVKTNYSEKVMSKKSDENWIIEKVFYQCITIELPDTTGVKIHATLYYIISEYRKVAESRSENHYIVAIMKTS